MNANPKRGTTIVFVFLLSILLFSCTAPTPFSEPEESEQHEQSEQPSEATVDFVVTFAGEGCDVSGPEEVPLGDYIVELDDQTDTNMLLYVSKLLDGKTFQEWVDEQETPGVYYPKPDYVEYAEKGYSSEKKSFIYKFNQPLVYVFYVYHIAPGEMLWKCGFTTVVE